MDPSGLDYIDPSNPSVGDSVYLVRTYYISYGWTGNTDRRIYIGKVERINGRLYLRLGEYLAPLEKAMTAALDAGGDWKDDTKLFAWFKANKVTDFSSTVGSGWAKEFGTNVFGVVHNAQQTGISAYWDTYIYGLFTSMIAAGGAGSGSKFTADQAALIRIAKDAKNRGGLTAEEAKILEQWAKEYGLKGGFRGPEAHPGRPYGQYPHYHCGPVDHIPVK